MNPLNIDNKVCIEKDYIFGTKKETHKKGPLKELLSLAINM